MTGGTALQSSLFIFASLVFLKMTIDSLANATLKVYTQGKQALHLTQLILFALLLQ